MAIVIEDAQREQRAEEIAVAEGVSVAEVLREGFPSLAGQRGLAPRKAPLRERHTALARGVDALRASVPADNSRSEPLLFVCNDFAQKDIQRC